MGDPPRVLRSMKVLLWFVGITATLFMLTRLFGSGATGDCDAVAEDMASYELGNYAEPDQRAPVVEKYRDMCKDKSVTDTESKCLVKAKNKLAAARCIPRLFPDIEVQEDCKDDLDCAMRSVDKFADRMCACGKNNTACANKVNQDMQT